MPFGVRAQASFDYFYIEAEKCRLAEDYSSAMDLYRHCLDINPEAPEALYNLGVLHLYLRGDSIGTALIRKAVERDPDNPYYLESLASICLTHRDAEAAIPLLERMATLQTRRSDVLGQLAQLYSSTGESAKAIEALNRIETLEGITPQVSLQKFSLYQEREQMDSAFMELQTLCDDQPHNMNLRVLMGNEYLRAGEKERALDIFDEVRRKEPSNRSLLMAMLQYYQREGENERYVHLRDSLLYGKDTETDMRITIMRQYINEAGQDTARLQAVETAFDSVLAMPQANAEMLTLRAAYQAYLDRPEQEIAQTMHRILDVDPGNENALVHLLQHYGKNQDNVALEDICRRGVNHHPEELAFFYYLAITLHQQDRKTEAMEILQQGLRSRTEETSPTLVSDMYAILGDILFQADRQAEAYAAYDSALVYHDDNISCLNNYAYYLSLHGQQLDRAEEMSYRTIRAEPNNVTYLDTYAWILFMKQDYTMARTYMDKVVDPSRSDDALLSDVMMTGTLLEHAADIHALCGDADTALRFWQLALRKNDGTCTPQLKRKIKKKKYIRL